MKTIIFFTAGTVLSQTEQTALTTLLQQTEEQRVLIRSAAQAMNYGPRLETCDFVAGPSVPDEYSEVPVWSPSSELPATDAVVSNGATVAVHNSAGADSHNATATVADNVLSDVKLAATVAMVDNADAVAVQNSAGTAVAGTHAAAVAAGALTAVKLAATVAPIVNGAALTVPVTGTYTTTATVTVANGVVTGIALS